VVHDLGLLQLLEERQRHAHLLLTLLDGTVHGAFDHLVPEVRDSELPHAPHRLLQLALDVVLLDQRADALLELLDGPPRANPPHVHDPRRAPVLVEQPLDESRNLPPTARVNQPPRHERDEDGGEHIVGDGTRDEVGKHRAHGRRVQRKVVDTPQGTDEALKELLAAVDPGQSRQQHARHLPLGVLLLQGGHQDALYYLIPVPCLLQVAELLYRLLQIPRHKILRHQLPHSLLELGDGQGQLQLRRYLVDDLLAQSLAGHRREVLQNALGDYLVFHEESNRVCGKVDGVRRRLLRLLQPAEQRLQPRLHVGSLQGVPHHERGEKLGAQPPLRLLLVD